MPDDPPQKPLAPPEEQQPVTHLVWADSGGSVSADARVDAPQTVHLDGGVPVTGELSVTAGNDTLEATVMVWPPDWIEQRQKLRVLVGQLQPMLRDLEPLVAQIDGVRQQLAALSPGIGHNQLPEAFDGPLLDTIQVTESIVATNVLRVQLASEQPQLESVRLSVLVLKRAASGIEALVGWLGKKGDIFADAFMKAAGKAAARAATVALAIKLLGDAHHGINEILVAIAKLADSLHLPLF